MLVIELCSGVYNGICDVFVFDGRELEGLWFRWIRGIGFTLCCLSGGLDACLGFDLSLLLLTLFGVCRVDLNACFDW